MALLSGPIYAQHFAEARRTDARKLEQRGEIYLKGAGSIASARPPIATPPLDDSAARGGGAPEIWGVTLRPIATESGEDGELKTPPL